MQHVVRKNTVIAAAGSLSSQTTGTHGTPGGGIDAAGLMLVGLELPATWTAADITLQASSDGTTFKNVYNADGTEFKITAPPADSMVPLAGILDTMAMRYIKVRSGTAAAAVPQAAERIITLLFREQRG